MTLPFENDTSFVIDKIVSAQLKYDKLKKGLTVAAIALAVFLMTAVLLLASGIIYVNQNGGNYITGSYHALISGITKEQYNKISTDPRIELSGLTASIGGIKDGEKRLNISYSNKDSLTLNGLSVSEGRMPEAENEIIIEEEYLLSQKIDAGIGDIISLPVSGGQKKADFVISGYLETAAGGTERILYAAIVSEEYFVTIDGWENFPSAIMFRIKKDVLAEHGNVEDIAAQIAADAGIEQPPSVNKAYAELTQPSALMIAAAVLGLAIIIMAGILVIYCIFYISTISSIKKYGQLRTIGMTAKQIKSLVFKEGFSLTLTAIPIGLLTGTLLSYVLVPQGFRISNMLWVCPLVVVLAYITVCLSIQKPAKIASTISPIEASRYEADNNLRKHTKNRRLSTYSLAKIQILRYKEKNMLTICSLILTGVLLLGLSSVLSSVDAKEMSLSGFTRGQFVIGLTNQELRENALEKVQTESPFTDEIYNALANVSGVKEIADDWHLPVSADLQAMESDAEIVGFVQDDMELIQSCISDGRISDYENLVSQNQLIIGRPDDFEETFRIQPEVGESVTWKVFDGNRSEVMQFEIAAILDENKIGNNGDKIDMLLLSVDSMKKIADSYLTYQYVIRVEDDFEQQAEKEIEQILAEHPRLDAVTLSSAIAQNENFLQGTEFALAAAIIFIGCFSVMNLLNTILTGIITRRKEFALMRSVGMSKRQLSSMIHYEGLIVVSVGLVLSLAIGGGIGYAVCMFLKSSLMSYLNYQFPFGIAILYCIIVILCSGIITEVALKYQNKLSVIELSR